MSDAEDFSKLSVDDRVSHKNWKARQSAYEQVATAFQRGSNTSIDFDLGLMIKAIVSDSNQISQEMGFGVLVEYLKLADSLHQKNVILPPVAEKCLSSTRSGIRTKSLEVLMLYMELSEHEAIFDSLLSVLDHKTPKVVSAATVAMREIAMNFGLTDYPLKKVLKSLPKLFDHKDKTVRLETSALAVQLYKWVGTAMMDSLKDIKPVQLKELTGFFADLPAETPTVLRCKRGATLPSAEVKDDVPLNDSQENAPSKEPLKVIDREENAPSKEPPKVIDAFDLADPVPFIDKIPKSFYSEITSSKWKERKEACEVVLKLVSFPKLEVGKYHELVNILAKRLQDPNVVVVTLVANVLEKMAKGLKASFGQYRNIVAHQILDRMKEKKTNVLEALRAALDALIASLSSFNEIMDDIMTSIGHSNPNVRTESIQAISRFLMTPSSSTRLGKTEMKHIVEKLSKTIDDSIPEIREVSAFALASMIHVFGEKNVTVLLDRLDASKMSKIMDNVSKIGSGNAIVEKKSIAPSLVAEKPKIVSAPKKPTLSKSKSMSKTSITTEKTNISPSASDSNLPAKYEFSDDSAVDYVETQIPGEHLTMMKDSNWKTRLEGITSFKSQISNNNFKVEPILRFLVKTIGWKETNFQVMMGMIEIFLLFTELGKGFDKGCAVLISSGLVDKLGDSKVKKVASLCLEAVATCTSLGTVLNESFASIKAMKSPKIISDALLWISQALNDFGVAGINIKELALFCKGYLGNPSPLVRGGSIAILVNIAVFEHPEVRNYLNDVSSSLQSQYDAELSKKASTNAPIPVKKQGILAETQPSANTSESKLDFGSAISAELLDQLNHSNWKERKLGLEQLSVIIDRSRGAIAPVLPSDFVNSFKNRLSDSNKNLASYSVDLLGKICCGIGKPFEKYTRTLIPPMLSQLSDQKITIRTQVLVNLEKIASVTGASSFVPCLLASIGTEQPQIRKEILGWMSDSSKSFDVDVSDSMNMVPGILACLLDKSIEVRKLALSVLIIISSKVDANSIRSKASDLYHGAQYSTIAPYLDNLGFKSSESPVTSSSTIAITKSETRQKPSSAKLGRSASILKKESVQNSPSTKVDLECAHLITSDIKLKEQRASTDKGVLKWNFEVPRKELVDLLADQFEGNVSLELSTLLFSADHYKEKDFLLALKKLDQFISESKEEEKPLAIQKCIANCDLILRYITLRFFDTNTSIFIKSLELLDNFISILDEGGYLLNEFEAGSFLPYFVNKLGDPKESMRTKLRNIMKKLGRVYPVSRLFTFILKGLDSKNAKTRAECLEEMASLIQRHGSSVLSSKFIPVIASQVADRDNSCRNAALNAVTQIYELMGEDCQKYLSKLSEKEKDMISERLRRLPGRTSNNVLKTGSANSRPQSSPVRNSSPLKEKLDGMSNIPKEFSLDLDKVGLGAPSKSLQPARTSESTINSQTEFSTDEIFYKRDADADAEFASLVSRLDSLDGDQAAEAAKSIEKMLSANYSLLKNIDVVGIVNPLVDATFSQIVSNPTYSPRFAKHLISSLLQIFGTKESAIFVPYLSLEACIKNIILRLVDSNLQQSDSTKTLPRALNMLMVRIIDNCEPNATFRALLLILKDGSVSDENWRNARDIQKKYTELAMKCLWKITKVIPSFLTAGSLHVDLLLLEINGFLVAAPPQFWKQKTSNEKDSPLDMPLRTVKTILHELVNHLGDGINAFLTVFPEQNHTTAYIRQMLQSVKKKSGVPVTTPAIIPSARSDIDFASQLDEIFSQIADKQDTKLGLQRLFELKSKFPSISPLVEERLAKTGSYFQGYIRRGLQSLEERKSAPAVVRDHHINPKDISLVVKGDSTDYDQTLQKLQKLFHSDETAQTPMVEKSFSPKRVVAAAAEVKIPGSATRESRSLAVQELKQRLARMKMSMSSNQL